MTSALLLSAFFYLFPLGLSKIFTTVIEKKDFISYQSLTLRDDFAYSAYYHSDGYKKEIKVLECFDHSCLSNKIFTIENSTDRKNSQTSIGVGTDQTIYVGFFNLDRGTFHLGILSSNRTTPSIHTLAGENGTLSYGFTDMVMLNDKNPLLLFEDQVNGVQYALCLNPPLCTNNEIKILDSRIYYNHYPPHATLDTDGYLNLCMGPSEKYPTRYIRCYDKSCSNKTITVLSTVSEFICKDIDINPQTNFAGLFMARSSLYQVELYLYSCQNLACDSFTTSFFSFAQSLELSGRYDKNGIPHIIYTDFSTDYMMIIYCSNPLCSEEEANYTILDDSARFRYQSKLELDTLGKEVGLYIENLESDLYYFRHFGSTLNPTISTIFPTLNPTNSTLFPTKIALTPTKERLNPTKFTTAPMLSFFNDPKKLLSLCIPLAMGVFAFLTTYTYCKYKRKKIEQIKALKEGSDANKA